jgi:integrase/recombinase XerD
MLERFEEFVQHQVYLKNVTPATVAWYRCSWKAFRLDNLQTISRADVTGAIVRLRSDGVSPVSVNTYLRCINAFLAWLHREGYSAEPLCIPKLKEPKKVLSTFTPEHIKTIVAFKPRTLNDRRIHTLACLLLDAGLRISEALQLRRKDLDLDNLLVKLNGKGAKQRIVPISLEMRKILFKWMREQSINSPEAMVFTTRTGTALSKRNAQRDLVTLAKRLHITGVRVSPHTFRHTFAVNYIRNGGSALHLQRVLGHSTLEMTRRYVNLDQSDLSAVHERLSCLARC